MSYRSKRTMAHMSTNDDSGGMKKVLNIVAGNDRWGPFSPLSNKVPETGSSDKVTPKKTNVALQSNNSKLMAQTSFDSSSLNNNHPHSHKQHKEAQHPSTQKFSNPKTQRPMKNANTTPQPSSQTLPPHKTQVPMEKTDKPHLEPIRAPIWKNPPTTKLNTLLGERNKSLEHDPPVKIRKTKLTTSTSINSGRVNNYETISSLDVGTQSNDILKEKPDTFPTKNGVESQPVAPEDKASDLGNDMGRGQQISGSKSFKPMCRNTRTHDWPDHIDFDEKEQVLAIDAEGKYQMISDSIQPPDIWHSNGLKYFVSFNEFYQPLRRGGHILVRFIGDVAKTERFCPIREINWHHVNMQYKVDIIKLIRAHFVIPEGDPYDQGILKRTGKSVRQYRHYLKKALFKPTQKTKDQIYLAGPQGHPRDSWIHLVDYWYSEKGKKFSEYGKEARSSQNHVHTTGSTSYANIRADFEDKNAREPSVLEIFEHTHRKKDGTFVKDTMTEDFLLDVDANVYTNIAFNPDSAKSRVEIENEEFNKLMYANEVPTRPVGYGFGVKQSDVFGVRGVLRKEGFYNGVTNNAAFQNMENIVANLTEENKSLLKQNEELQTKYNENNCLLKKMTTQFGQILDVLSTGKAPTEFLDLAKTVLNSTNSQL